MRLMRLILRIAGTWLVGLALVLAVIDGTKSLGADALVLTSLEQAWTNISPASLVNVQTFLGGRYFADFLDGVMAVLLGYPAFAVIGVPGFVLALLGRAPRRDRYIEQDQF